VWPSRLANPYEALGFLLHPILPLFKGQSLVRTVKKLEFLAVLFDDKVLVAERVNWESPFATDFSFLRAIRDIDPEKIAAKIAESDCKMFSRLSPRDFDLPNKGHLLYIGKKWNTIADTVKACVIADSNLVQPLSKLVVVRGVLPILFSIAKSLRCSICLVYGIITLGPLCLLASVMQKDIIVRY
jgi:hypothetical protein